MRDTRDSSATTSLNTAGQNKGVLLSSGSNAIIKSVRLLGKRRERQRRHETWVEGARELERALLGGWKISEALVREDAMSSHKKILEAAHSWHPVSAKLFDSLVYRGGSVSIAAVCQIPPPLDIDWTVSLMILDDVEKPGNIGAVMRSVEASGFPQIVICGVADPDNPNAIRASVGARFLVPVIQSAREDLQEQVRQSHLPVYLVCPGASNPWPPVLQEPAVYVLGAEDKGLHPSWMPLGHALSLPMLGQVDSLNVAQTATVILYKRLELVAVG